MHDPISNSGLDGDDLFGLDRPNLKAAAAAKIRERILTGTYRPGEKVNQDALATEFGVSRLPIREALIVLESEGLVENIARRGAFIAEVSREDILDHYAIFGAIAGLAAARAATTMTTDDLARLRQLVTEMRDETSSTGVDRLCYRFHRCVNQAGARRRLRSELRRLSEGIPARLFTFAPEWQAQADADHVEILHALSCGDAVLAYESTREHLRRSGNFAVRRLELSGFWADPTAAAPADASVPQNLATA